MLGIVLERGATLREPVDILLLFVSTFAFFFSTLVLNNAARRLARRSTWGVETEINRASAMSEYLGQYTFIAALPLLVVRFIGPAESVPGGSGSAGRTLVTWTVSILAWVMLLGYHSMEGTGFFTADFGGRSFLSGRQKQVLAAIIAVDTALLFFTPLIHGVPSWIQWVAALLLVALLIILVVAAWALSEVVDDHNYKVDVWDAMGAEEASFTDPDWRRGS
jgi:protein-S-isoprenylcysteine O-methyltransferase Ste14